jgi:hypothetical protein
MENSLRKGEDRETLLVDIRPTNSLPKRWGRQLLLLDMPGANSLRSFFQVKGKGQELKDESSLGLLSSFDL